MGVIVIVLAGWAAINSNPQKQYDGYVAQERAERKVGDRPSGSTYSGASRAPVSEQQTSGHTGDRNSDADWRELVAQESMAESTRSMKTAAWVSIAISVLGLLGLAATVYFTGRAANSAREAAEHARRAYIVDSAPYLVLKPIDAKRIRISPKALSPLPDDILCEIENTGRGPAVVTSILRAWQVTEKLTEPSTIKPLAQMASGFRRKAISLPIGPNGTSPPLNALVD